MTARHVKVVLSGEGADEIFAGYSNYAKRLQEAPISANGEDFMPLSIGLCQRNCEKTGL